MDSEDLQRAIQSGNQMRDMMESIRVAQGWAHVLYERLMKQAASFESDLTDEEELGGFFASFGREVLVRIEDVGYQNPYFLTFDGVAIESGKRVRLVQHTTQLSVLFVAVPRAPEHPTPKRIGFKSES